MTHKVVDGNEIWRDSFRNLTRIKFRDGTEYDYDERGHITHAKWPDGTEAWYDYDADGNCTQNNKEKK